MNYYVDAYPNNFCKKKKYEKKIFFKQILNLSFDFLSLFQNKVLLTEDKENAILYSKDEMKVRTLGEKTSR